MLFGQQRQERAEVRRVEFLVRGELPEQGAEAITELDYAGFEEVLDRVSRFREHAPDSSKARTFDAEHKAIRRLARPFAETLPLLRAIEGRVDLGRGEMGGRVGKLLRLREALRVEDAAPGREIPAAHADIDCAGTFHAGNH